MRCNTRFWRNPYGKRCKQRFNTFHSIVSISISIIRSQDICQILYLSIFGLKVKSSIKDLKHEILIWTFEDHNKLPAMYVEHNRISSFICLNTFNLSLSPALNCLLITFEPYKVRENWFINQFRIKSWSGKKEGKIISAKEKFEFQLQKVQKNLH